MYQYLGIKLIELSDDKTKGATQVEMHQTRLIEKVLKTTNMMDSNVKGTPVSEKPLGLDEDGAPFAESWDYVSVVGMLLYVVHT